MAAPLFSIRELYKARTEGPGYALSIPELDVAPGEKIGITGPSGSGKSTALDLLGMVLRPDRAKRFLFRPEPAASAVDVPAAWEKGGQNLLGKLRLQHMGYVLQTGGLLPFLNVEQNMELAAAALDQPDRRDTVAGLAGRLGLDRLLRARPGRLSIGERQRVAIGRALASRPRVILADEPTAALDPVHAATVLELLLDAVDALGVTLILVTHDPDIVSGYGLRELKVSLRPGSDSSVLAVLGE